VRLLLKIIGILVAIVLLIPCALALWVYFSPFGIPDVKHLQVLAPTERTQANFPDCGGSATATAIPGIEMGRFRDALIAAEGDPRNEATFRETARLFLPHQYPKRQASYSAHLAQRLNCPPANWIEHEIKTIRTAVQIERRFKPDDILTIVSNSVYFGNETYGIENASKAYFNKKAMQLSVGEAATLAALIHRPAFYLKHPDTATERRNQVLDAMLQSHLASSKEVEVAKSEPLKLRL
jgi:hypothetical protein